MGADNLAAAKLIIHKTLIKKYLRSPRKVSMHNFFENLLVSSPNGGGLFFSHGGEVFCLDTMNTTGIFYRRNIFLRGFQPNDLCIYDDSVHLISGVSANFDDVHDVLWEDDHCYVVGTSGNEIIKLSRRGDELQRWVFPGDMDSWHINCLGIWSGRVVFSAFGDFREHLGYKGRSLEAGFVQDLLSGERLISGLSQPHSLVAFEDRLFLANSEQREIIEVSADGNILRVKQLDGYTRGIVIIENIIYIGLSCSRNIEVEGVTSATVVALDLETLEELGRLQIPAKEIYAIQHISDRDDLARVLAIVGSTSSAMFKESLDKYAGQIASLNQAVTDRDGQIASLNQAVTDRDGQIASLNQAVTDRDGQIASLNQAVTDRDGQIASFTDETVRRSEWALRLDVELKETQAKLAAITQSNSWRLTKPLRETRRRMTQTKARHRSLVSGLFSKLLVMSSSLETIPALSVPVNHLPAPELDPDKIQLNGSVAIALPTSTSPFVSVIIPIYGKIEYTLHCLDSIAKNSPEAPFEVIVVDDCSPDNSVEVLQQVQGIRLIQNTVNHGFIRSCNIGAQAARSDYLHFLNNDTQVTPGWLDELLRTFREFPGTGLAGSKLVYPDGRLQEAGGIIWQDGSAWNFGRFQDPLLPSYNYAREVDYCSGASIMVPKALFDELGGFDEHYLPAYCEDCDLALNLRDKGYRVIYQPLSTVIHYEGITSGTDTTQGTKAYQVENSKKLFERWQPRLKTHQAPGTEVDNAKDRRATRRALVIDHCTPTPNQDAGSVIAFNLLLLLREMDFQVTFIPEDNFLYLPDYTTALQRAGIEVLYAPYVISVKQHLEEYGERYDLAYLFRPGVVDQHLKDIRQLCPKAKVLYDTVDLHFLRMSREAELQSDKTKQKAADQMKQRELAAICAVDASILHSTAEMELMRHFLPEAKLHLFPLIMDIKGTSKPFAERSDIVFVGGYQHTPNVDAVQYFAEEIMPLLRKQLPGVRFYAVGSKTPAEIQALTSEDIIITGFVEDLTPLLDKMRVSVAPLRYGAGIKGKIGTAMVVGLPVVATSLAVEGMSLTDGENILVADGAEAFANAVAKIYQDEALWNRIGQNGLAFADKAWGAEAAWGILASILRELGFNPARGNKQLSLYVSSCSGTSEEDSTRLQNSTVQADDAYQKTIQQELAIYEKQINVHDLPDIYHYWSNKYLAPVFHDAGFSTIADFFSSNLLTAATRTRCIKANFVSVGAGNCDLEVDVAKNLVNAGFNSFTIECLEINPAMLDRGRGIAKENGVLGNMRFVKADFNTWDANKKYDGIMANQSLHHVTRLEHLFDQIKNALHEDGSFVISDMIGRNGHQRWPESLEIVNKYWKELPESKKFNGLLNRLEKEYENWDCSKVGFEGIRAQDVLPLLLERFQCEKFVGFGSAIDIFVDRCFGHNFHRDSESDRDFIGRVHEEDESALLSGKLTPTHMIAVFVKTMHCAPYYSRGITPNSSVRHLNSKVR